MADLVRYAKHPFDPAEVTHSYAGLLQDYRIRQVTGDNYAADWVTATFKDAGIKFVRSEYSKSRTLPRSAPIVHARTDRDPRPTTVAERTPTARASNASLRQGHGRSWQARRDDLSERTVWVCSALREKGHLQVRSGLGPWGVLVGQECRGP